MQQSLDRHRPLLVVVGLTAIAGRLDRWLSSRGLPLALPAVLARYPRNSPCRAAPTPTRSGRTTRVKKDPR